jgi:beta-lactamase regulating signal transducer with metallopeptidase domain
MNYVVGLLGWVALEAAWQTFAVALLLLLSLRLMRGAPAPRRYRCAVRHLTAVIGAVALTAIVSHASVAAGTVLAPGGGARASWLPGVADRAQPLLRAAAWSWLGGIAAAQILLAVRFLRLRRFLRNAEAARREIAATVDELSCTLGLSSPPEVLCADVRSPMVAGWRHASLVVPRRFAETHPPAEMRALLAHELAHILRRDYAGNILRLAAASVMWWHPAVWLICARIGHERECSCDELAAQLLGSAAPLANALLRLADAPPAGEPFAMAAGASGLADRISRLAPPQGCRLRRTTHPLLAAAGVTLTAIVVASSTAASHGEALTRAFAASAAAPPTVFTIQAHDPGGTFQVRMLRGRVVAIVLGRERVPPGRVEQVGDMVKVVGKAGQELLRIEVDPRGGLRWTPRRAA